MLEERLNECFIFEIENDIGNRYYIKRILKSRKMWGKKYYRRLVGS